MKDAAETLPDLEGLAPAALRETLAGMGEKPFRAGQIFRQVHFRRAASFDEMTDLPRQLRARLAQRFSLGTPAIESVQASCDGTRKFRLRTRDGRFVEAVYMPDEEKGRRTLCVSTQVGCAMGCSFCLTGTMGLVRNLTPAEIAGEVHRVNSDLTQCGIPGPRPLTNLVFMGMGEPLHNLDNLLAALELLLHADGAGFSHRHVTVSTSGLVPGIDRIGRESEVKLAVSLNASRDEERDVLMPVNRRWPLAELMAACRRFPLRNGRRITFEYVLLRGVNDSDDDAHRVAALLQGLPAKVNLIAYNENAGLGYAEPDPERVARFREILDACRIVAMVRKNRGRDISAACGQLAVAGQGRPRPRPPGAPAMPLPVV